MKSIRMATRMRGIKVSTALEAITRTRSQNRTTHETKHAAARRHSSNFPGPSFIVALLITLPRKPYRRDPVAVEGWRKKGHHSRAGQ